MLLPILEELSLIPNNKMPLDGDESLPTLFAWRAWKLLQRW